MSENISYYIYDLNIEISKKYFNIIRDILIKASKSGLLWEYKEGLQALEIEDLFYEISGFVAIIENDKLKIIDNDVEFYNNILVQFWYILAPYIDNGCFIDFNLYYNENCELDFKWNFIDGNIYESQGIIEYDDVKSSINTSMAKGEYYYINYLDLDIRFDKNNIDKLTKIMALYIDDDWDDAGYAKKIKHDFRSLFYAFNGFGIDDSDILLDPEYEYHCVCGECVHCLARKDKNCFYVSEIITDNAKLFCNKTIALWKELAKYISNDCYIDFSIYNPNGCNGDRDKHYRWEFKDGKIEKYNGQLVYKNFKMKELENAKTMETT